MKKNHCRLLVLLLAASVTIPTGCKKATDSTPVPEEMTVETTAPKGIYASQLSSVVAQKWILMEMHIMQTTTGISNVGFVHPYAYSGIAFYESVKPGMPANRSLSGQLTGMPVIPHPNWSDRYYWPSSANACMASILKKLYPTTSAANVASIDSLENALNTEYSALESASTITRSINFGRTVAQLIYDWSETDGYLNASNPYIPPTGPGLWVPTPPAYAPATAPYWGNLRVMIAGSGNNAQPPPPPPYSEVVGSPFYYMAKHVYDVSQTLTQAQIDQAFYWRDIPGYSGAGHFLSILQQVLVNDNVPLNKAAGAFALTCIDVFDATISCWQTKYAYNQVRPVTYIRTVLGHPTWNPVLTTPAHPEYTSAHAVLSAANAYALESIFGKNHPFTDHTYDYLGFPSRSYSSFKDIGQDAGNSRVFAGIHYQPSCNFGLAQGYRVADNIKHLIHIGTF